MDRNKKKSSKLARESKQSVTGSIRTSFRLSKMSYNEAEEIQESEGESSQEVDIDENVIRSSTRHHLNIENPCSVSVENSRVFDLLQSEFPSEFPKNMEWPYFDAMLASDCVQYLGHVLGCENHEENLASFWLLDTLCEVLRQGQINEVSNENLNVTCLWFFYILKALSVYAQSREDFFADVNEMLFEAENEYLENGRIMLPKEVSEKINEKKLKATDDMKGEISLFDVLPETKEIDVSSESNEALASANVSLENIITDPQERGDSLVVDGLEKDGTNECLKLNELQFLTEQIFRVFGNRFKFEVIKTVFSSPPEIKPVIIVEKMNFPKDLGLSQRIMHEMNMKRRRTKEIQTSNVKNDKKSAMKGKKKGKIETEPVGNTAVEKFKRELHIIDWEREDQMEKERTKDFYIKPLEDSVDQEYFQRLFPRHESRAAAENKPKEKPEPKGKNPKKKK